MRKLAFLFILLVGLSSGESQAEVIYAIPLSGTEHQIGNVLEWSTATELNSEAFIVEKSTDGKSFYHAGTIEAAGQSSQEKPYRYLDINATNGSAFYRLKQLDKDGTASFSETIRINKKMSNDFLIVSMSNVKVSHTFELSVDAIAEGEVSYDISSLRGDQIQQGSFSLEYGLNDLYFDLENEAEGNYRLTLTKGNEVEQLVIQKVDDEIRRKENVASKRSSSGG